MRWGDKVIGLEMGGLSLHRFIISGIFDIWDVDLHSCAIACARDAYMKPSSVILLFLNAKEGKCRCSNLLPKNASSEVKQLMDQFIQHRGMILIILLNTLFFDSLSLTLSL